MKQNETIVVIDRSSHNTMVVKISFYAFIGHINLVCLLVYVTSFSHTKLPSFKLEFNV